MQGHNSITLYGNMGRDCELRGSGTPVGNFSLAVGGRAKVNGEWVDQTDWFDVVCFGKTAENVKQYTSKGSQVIVVGSVHHKVWKKQDGTEKWSIEVRADKVIFIGGKGKEDPPKRSAPQYTDDSDLPF